MRRHNFLIDEASEGITIETIIANHLTVLVGDLRVHDLQTN
jgi:hypothetical protein